MNEIKISKKASITIESARLLAQVDKERDINTSQMVELLAKDYLGQTKKSSEIEVKMTYRPDYIKELSENMKILEKEIETKKLNLRLVEEEIQRIIDSEFPNGL